MLIEPDAGVHFSSPRPRPQQPPLTPRLPFPLLPARIILDDGSVWPGFSPSPSGVYPLSEFVFNTATAGYEEVITDPSYQGQVVVFTTPHLGTTGWTGVESEGSSPAVAGVVCRDLVSHHDNHLALERLGDVLLAAGVPVVTGVDTRALTLRIRERGSMQGCVLVGGALEEESSNTVPDLDVPLELMPSAAFPSGGLFWGVDVGAAVPLTPALDASTLHGSQADSRQLQVGVVDFGVKVSILQALRVRGIKVHLLPWDGVELWSGLLGELDGVLFSNGAGDPRCLIERPHLLAVYRKIAETLPTMGICFGHQALALAFGACIDKLTFGHHAVNHPVARVDKDGSVKSVAITSQNHNYAVSRDGLPASLIVSHLHLNDGTIAGLRHRDGLFQSVQFHPEAGPGPRDAGELFDEFVESLKVLG